MRPRSNDRSVTSTTGASAPHPNARILGRLGIERFSGLYIWAGFIILFGLLTAHTFLTTSTLTSVLNEQAVTGILAIGLLAPLAAGVFDLSAAQNLGFAAVGSGWLMSHEHLSPIAAVVITLSAGGLVGCANGFFVTVVGVNSFIATLGMTSVLLAITEAIAKGQYFGPFASSFANVTSGSVIGIPIIFIYLLIVAVIAWYVLEHTPLGRRVHACGANTEAARLTGVPTQHYIFGSFVVCGMMASLAGILLASQLGSVSQTIGPSYLLPAFAAAFLGTTQLKPERFNVWGTLIALYLLATGVEGLQLLGAQLWVTDLFNGVALIGAVSVAVLSERRRAYSETQASEIDQLEATAPVSTTKPADGDASGPGPVDRQAQVKEKSR
jgi:ribose transport system permease protein